MTDQKKYLKWKTVIDHYGRFFVLGVLIWSCSSVEELAEKPMYNGPIMSLDSVNTALSDSGLVVLRKKAPKEEQFENRDVEWPKGLSLKYFDEAGVVSSTFQSDYAFYEFKEDLYKGTGNVIVTNATTGDELRTEELFWNPKANQFYTEKFVTIRTEDEIHTGEGLTANQDFSMYTILKPAGTFTLSERIKTPTDEIN